MIIETEIQTCWKIALKYAIDVLHFELKFVICKLSIEF